MPEDNYPSENINRIDVDESLVNEDNSELVDLDLPEDLQKILFYAFDEAVRNLDAQGSVQPFTVTLAGDDIFVDQFEDSEEEECFSLAREAVNMVAHIAGAYVFCYDGFIELEDGSESDMLIAEIGEKGCDTARAFGLMYRSQGDGTFDYDEAMVDLGDVDCLFDPEAVAAAEEMAAAYGDADGDGDADDVAPGNDAE